MSDTNQPSPQNIPSTASGSNAAPMTREVSDRLDSFICTNCGAELLVEPGAEYENCPFCGGDASLPGRSSAALPDACIPFAIDPAEASRRCRDYCSSRLMLPSSFVKQLSLAHMQGIFIPFWLYSGSASLELKYRAAGKDKKQKILSCTGNLEYQKLPIPASALLSDSFLDLLMPYDYSALQPFHPDIMSGHMSEAFEEDHSDASDSEDGIGELLRSIGAEEKQAGSKAVLELEKDVLGEQGSRIARGQLPYHIENEISVQAKPVNSVHERILVPLYYLHMVWHKKEYCFGINGQTGKVYAEYPINRFQMFRLQFFSFFTSLPVVFLLLMLVCMSMSADSDHMMLFVAVCGLISIAVASFFTYFFMLSLQAESEKKARKFYTTFFVDETITDRHVSERDT